MDDEPIWAADRVVAPTPGSAITIPETANEFAIKAKTWLDELNEGTIEMWDELRTAFISRFFPPALFDRFDRLADKQSGRPSGSLHSNTQPNPKGHNSKAYQPSQYRNEHVNAVFTRSDKSYNPPVNPNDQPTESETPINFDSDDEDEEPTPQPKT
ncbi:hypothetical protein Tco_0739509 [Tanacetum coccineum]